MIAPRGAPRRRSEDFQPVFVVDAASEGIIGIDDRGIIRSWNPAARRIFGYGAAEIVDHSLAELLLPDRRALIEDFLKRMRRNPWIAYGEASCLRKGSARVEIAFSALPGCTIGPEESGLCLVVHDITERKHAEKDLQAAIARFESAERLNHVGSWEWDVARDAVTWSPLIHDLLGAAPVPRRVTYEGLLQSVLPKDRARVRTRLERTLSEGIPFEEFISLRREDGRTVEIYARAIRVLKKGGPGSLVGTFQDVRRLRAAAGRATRLLGEQSRHASGRQVRALLLARAAAVLLGTFDYEAALSRVVTAAVPVLAERCVLDVRREDGSVARWSDPPLFGSGIGPERASGVPGRVWATGESEFHPRIDPGSLAQLLPDPLAYGLEPQHPPASLLAVPLRDRGGVRGVLLLIRRTPEPSPRTADLLAAQKLATLMTLAIDHGRMHAELSRQARELAWLNQELEARVERRTAQLAEAVRNLDAFAHTVAHDLRAPLRAIDAFAEELAREEIPPRELVPRIREGCRRMDDFIRDLLTYSTTGRREPPLEALDLARVIEDARARTRSELEARKARVAVASPLPRVLGNESLLIQAVANLLSNAAKFVAPGVEPSIRLFAERRGSVVRLWVEDNGIGVAPEHVESIFAPFERLHPHGVYPGTGLGLAIVRRAVERMSGRSGVESAPGLGSRFWIDLPPAPA